MTEPASAPSDTPLHFVVPARRAVVRASCGYAEVYAAWIAELRAAREAFEAWYLEPWGGDVDFERGIRWLTRLQAFVARQGDPRASQAAAPLTTPTAAQTVDRPVTAWARLWKGPYRVLQEQERGADDAALGILNGQREVRRFGARFFPGDLLELPVHRFLAACDPRQGDHAGRLWYCQFNGEGSPFLGDTVVDPDGAVIAGDLAQHDNILGMRWQLMINLALAAWYHPQALYRNACGAGFRGEVEGLRIYARGMMYGATFTTRCRPDEDAGEPARPHWLYGSLHWGRSRRVLPTDHSFRTNLQPRQPLTPAWSCSPCTLAVTFFLHDLERRAREGVHHEVEQGAYTPRTITRAELLAGRDDDPFVPVRLLPHPGELPHDTVEPAGWTPGDVTVAGLYRHEQAMVKLFPPDLLRERRPASGVPHLGFLSAYDPVTGADFFDEPGVRQTGQLWKFEASGAMHPGNPQRMGAGPHRWEKLVDNTVYFIPVEDACRYGSGHGLRYRRPSRGDKAGQAFKDFLAFDLDESSLGGVYAPGRSYRPIAVGDAHLRPLSGERGDAGEFLRLYAERAVPFHTFEEYTRAARGYRPVSQLMP